MSVLRFEPLRDPFERLFSMAATGTRAPLGMPMDVYRGEDGSYHVEADLPGADPDSIEVTVEHGTLTIQAERTPHYGGSEQVIVAERPQGSFTRQLTLGAGVDSGNVLASLSTDGGSISVQSNLLGTGALGMSRLPGVTTGQLMLIGGTVTTM